MNEILTVEQSYAADKAAEKAGIASYDLMEAAGKAAADAALRLMPARPVVVLCGLGNNGGDGFVAARRLKEMGRPVQVFLLGERDALKGDAAEAAKRWGGEVGTLTDESVSEAGVVIDALFGAGLSRPLDGVPAALAAATKQNGAPVLSIDVPSGIDGDSGKPKDGGEFFDAAVTVTFFRKKPAHVLYPGSAISGQVVVADIGIPGAVLNEIQPKLRENGPPLWAHGLPRPPLDAHKHSRGRLAVVSGNALATGAARLAARAGQRAGAGFTTLFGDEAATRINAAHETSIVVKAAAPGEATADAIRVFGAHAAVAGPGAGVNEQTRALVSSLLEEELSLVLDADVLTAFADDRDRFFSKLSGRCVLTPHEGEFARLFPDLAENGATKIVRAATAAGISGAVVLLKGPDTVIAAPDGRVVVNTVSSPYLASAGTGDVLAGIIGGLAAQHMDVFMAAAAGTWLHGRAAQALGIGLIAEDLIDAVPRLLRGASSS